MAVRGARTVSRLKFFARNVLTDRPHIYRENGRWKVRRVPDYGIGMVNNSIARDTVKYYNGREST